MNRAKLAARQDRSVTSVSRGAALIDQRDQARTACFVFAALAIGLAYLFGGFVPRHERLIAPAALLCLAAVFWLGLRRSSAVAPLVRLRTATVCTLAISVVLVTPAGTRWVWLQQEARAVPIPADAYDIQRDINVVLWDRDPPPYEVLYATHISFDEADRFLTREFLANRWDVGQRSRVWTYGALQGPNYGMALQLNRQPCAGRLLDYTLFRGDRAMNVWLFDAGDERWIQCWKQIDPPPKTLQGFWR